MIFERKSTKNPQNSWMRVIHLKRQIHCCLIKSNRFSLNFSACIGTLTTRSALIHGLDCFRKSNVLPAAAISELHWRTIGEKEQHSRAFVSKCCSGSAGEQWFSWPLRVGFADFGQLSATFARRAFSDHKRKKRKRFAFPGSACYISDNI